jgi:hypothetical protein
MTQRPPILSIALVSAAALAFEILLMRLFSIIQWHHFSYMIIGLALLGYGYSGTIVAIFQQYMIRHFRVIYLSCLYLFAISTVASFLWAQSLPFNAEMILWDYRQALYLAVLFLVLSLPFFFAATAICLAFIYYRDQVPRIYAWDLAGAGVGSVAIIGLLFLVFAENALVILGLTGLLALLVASVETKLRKVIVFRLGLLSFMTALVVILTHVDLQLSPYKSLVQALRVNGTSVVSQASSPYGLISVIESSQVPFRYAPGQSLASTAEPLPQLGLFTDGDNMTVITAAAEDRAQLSYLDQVSSALPYHLDKPRSVLIVGAGGGTDILQALYHQTPDIDAVELNPQLIDVVGNRYAGFNGNLFHRPGVDVFSGDVRGYLATAAKKYDLIQLPLIDAFNASSSGLYALNEDYMYTVDALDQYLRHLNEGGYLVVTRWVKIPPRDTLKLFATAVDALHAGGVEDIAARLVLVRSWQTSTLLIKNGKVTEQELASVRAFSSERSFDIDFAAGRELTERRYNRLAADWFRDGTAAIISAGRNQFINDYKFDLLPATDNRPYFHQFAKWSSMPELLSLRDRGGMSLIEWGYVVLVLTLVVAGILSVILITLPLLFLPRQEKNQQQGVSRTRVILYFLSIGIAFLFMEIAFMQKFILFLHQPLYSFAVTLSVFLVFAGLGSLLSPKLVKKYNEQLILTVAVSGIVAISTSYVLFLDDLFALLSALPLLVRIGITALLVAPLAFFMGMPFPLALSSLAENAKSMIPWAWGINGCASVISASLATLLAIQHGFNLVILTAVLLYAGIAFLFPGAIKKRGNII